MDKGGIRVGRWICRGWNMRGMREDRERERKIQLTFPQATNQPSRTEITSVSESVCWSNPLQEALFGPNESHCIHRGKGRSQMYAIVRSVMG